MSEKNIGERLEEIQQSNQLVEGFLGRHLQTLIELTADEEVRKIEIRKFMAWLEEKTGYKFKPIRHVRTKFDRQKWEEFRATLHRNAATGKQFEAKRIAALTRVAEYRALHEPKSEQS